MVFIASVLSKYCRYDYKWDEEKNGIYWKDQKDDMDGVTIPTPYLQQFLHSEKIETIRHEAYWPASEGGIFFFCLFVLSFKKNVIKDE